MRLVEDAEVLIEKRDHLATARRNVATALELGTSAQMTEFLIRLALTEATIAAATEQRTANKLAYLALYSHTATGHRLRAEVEAEL